MKRRFVVPLIFAIGGLVALDGRTARASLADCMKMCLNRQFLLSVLVVGFGVMLAGPLSAQTFTVLDSLTTVYGGVAPYSGLIVASNKLYGTTNQGGTNNNGTVFTVNIDGTGYTVLHSFSVLSGTPPAQINQNSDGANPWAGLVFSGETLYGTAVNGGSAGNGTVFAINPDGTGFKVLHNFTTLSGSAQTNSDGANPNGGLILLGGTLYGTTFSGGASGNGTVFKLNAEGFSTLHDFSEVTATNAYGEPVINSEGTHPFGRLVVSGSTLYGTASQGGSGGNGTVFAVNIDGTSFTNLYSFSPTSGNPGVNSDGANPYGDLLLSSGILFGTAANGGPSENGTVFAIHTDGTGFIILHRFTDSIAYTNSSGVVFFTNSDGAFPLGGLILSGNSLYGSAANGGSAGNGTVFAVNTDGTGFTNLHSFVPVVGYGAVGGEWPINTDGANPYGGLVLLGSTLYGATSEGGTGGYGTIYDISLPSLAPPQMAIAASGSNVLVTWPTNFTGFTLQSTTNLAAPVWTANLPAPVVVNGQYTVTNPASGTQQFFRLSQ